MATLRKARGAKQKLAEAFAQASVQTNGIGIKGKNNDYSVVVNLPRQPTAGEKSSLPNVCDGVDVSYKVTGRVKAR